ncbi:MAG: DUF4065 domain-containing protein [Muribaculaceae bacterium]|nr:DUF4065 domain-containing protein [Muribaculaceae bacterium]
MYLAKEIADWILSRINIESGDTISPLKLQKLLYYCQAWHYTIFNEPLFDEDIEAWAHGPVVPSQYSRFADTPRYTNINITQVEITPPTLPNDSRELLEEVMDIYGEHSASYLEQLTHKERPWLETRGDLPEYAKSDKVIPLRLMYQYYHSVNVK